MLEGVPVRTLKGNSKLSHAPNTQSCSYATCLFVPPLCSDSTAGVPLRELAKLQLCSLPAGLSQQARVRKQADISGPENTSDPKHVLKRTELDMIILLNPVPPEDFLSF